ncbi:MAG: flagellar hook-basal body complex protein FliE [Candidatus Adiutrix sp.]|jgi:flagellar hook-basal body complex protein FliE|nr:flagellar hook-basal body complex protein FliE [Candidatus Adiutrix sp.]
MLIRPLKPVSTPALEMAPASKVQAQPGFAEHLKASLMTANALQHQSSTAQQELATGRNGNIHETLIAMNKADVSFRMITQVRNKILQAYQEVMRMQ